VIASTLPAYPAFMTPAQILKEESRDPSVFKRAKLFMLVQLYEVKFPPITIFPSDCILISLIIPYHIQSGADTEDHALKELSTDPSVFKRTNLFAEVPL
jgi:hypothetical protein